MTAHYGVAHMTVQRALQELKHDGLIFSVQGKGTYVHRARGSAPSRPARRANRR